MVVAGGENVSSVGGGSSSGDGISGGGRSRGRSSG